MVDASCSLIVVHALLAHVEVIVGVVAGTHNSGLPHHRRSAHVHRVGLGRVLGKHDGCRLRKSAGRDHILYAVVFELLADILGIRFADGEAGVEAGIGCGGGWVVDINTALAKVS